MPQTGTTGAGGRTRKWLATLVLLGAVCASAGEAATPAAVDGTPRSAAPPGPDSEDDGPLAEVVPLPPLKRIPATVRQPGGLRDAGKAPAATNRTAKPPTAFLPKEPGYAMVLGGILDADLELAPERSPVLIRGDFTVPEGVTLRIKAGTCVHLRAAVAQSAVSRRDPEGGATADCGTGILPVSTAWKAVPQAAQNVWVWGTLIAEGITGNPVELTNQEKQSAALLFYGAEQSRLEGVRLKGLAVTQTGGVCLWTNCEFAGTNYYALASGAGLFTQCSFRNCGGIFANYKVGPWSLLVRRSLFDGCREGIVLGSDPGETRLIIEKNCFFRTRGAHIRVMPVVNAQGVPDTRAKAGDTEFLIGENWYGSAVPEEAELRLVDCRVDPAVRARLNTRPPAERPYTNTGAGVSAGVLAATLREQQTVQQRLLRAHPLPQPKPPEKNQAAAMSKAVSRPK